jgi:hypothetical protein
MPPEPRSMILDQEGAALRIISVQPTGSVSL